MDGSRILFAAALAAVLLAGCTDVGGDADGDGLPNADEEEPRRIEVDTADGTEIRNVTSDPQKVDTDGDGLNDFDEFRAGTDPRDVDTDGDALADGPNITNPDGDLLTRLEEAGVIKKDGVWLGEEGVCGDQSSDPTNWDSDSPQIDGRGDGLGDGEEVRGWNATPQDTPVQVSASPCLRDTDGDDLNDRAERNRSTDPRNPDTDGDGVEDRLDADPLWDLSLTFALESVTLKQDKDGTGGADLRFSVQVVSNRDVFWNNVTSTGTYDLSRSYDDVEVDDQSATYQEKSVPVFIRLFDDDATDEQPVAFTPDGNAANMEVHLFEETLTRDGEQVGSGGSATLSGADADLTLSYETVRG